MPSSPSLYDALGVSRQATTEEIRKAYKDQAKQKHPDRGGDPEEFKAIQQAHEILSDEGRRKMYDMTGSTEEGQGGPGGPMGGVAGGGMAAGGIPFEFMRGMGPFGMPGVSFDFGSMFNGMFGGGGPGGPGGNQRSQRAAKGPNKYHDLGLTLGDFYAGREIKMKFKQSRFCTGCAGSGAATTEPCGACGGRGVRTQTRVLGPGMLAQSTGPCDVCSGEGKRIIRVCGTCHGKRFIEKEKELAVVIQPGMHEGETVVFSGECSDAAEYETPGDVVLTLKRADGDSAWEWKGADIHCRRTISFAESVLGFRSSLEGHPSGKQVVVGWKRGVLISGTILKAAGWGMPKKDGSKGDCYITFEVQQPDPREWSEVEREQLAALLGAADAAVEIGEDVVELQK